MSVEIELPITWDSHSLRSIFRGSVQSHELQSWGVSEFIIFWKPRIFKVYSPRGETTKVSVKTSQTITFIELAEKSLLISSCIKMLYTANNTTWMSDSDHKMIQLFLSCSWKHSICNTSFLMLLKTCGSHKDFEMTFNVREMYRKNFKLFFHGSTSCQWLRNSMGALKRALKMKTLSSSRKK